MNMGVYAVLFSTKFLPFMYALLGFGLLITIHECGHFLFCKLFRIHTPTFSIGMGPTIFKRKIGKTDFRLAAIPIGGYVEIAGMAEVGQGEQANAYDVGANSFSSKPYWQRLLVLLGGVLFNMLFAYIVFAGLFFTGMPVPEKIDLIVRSTGRDALGLQIGDKIVSVNEYVLHADPKRLFPALQHIATKIAKEETEETIIRVERNKKFIDVAIPAKKNGTNLQRGLLAGASLDIKTVKLSYEKYPFFQAIKKGVSKTHEWVGKFIVSLKMLVTKRNIKDFGGPIAIVTQSFKMAQDGLQLLLVFLAIISINLAVINVLPIGALDGGQILFETVEAIIRRRIPEVIRFSINLASWVLILGLILFLSYQDIISLFMG